jgi:hypothetical protein
MGKAACELKSKTNYLDQSGFSFKFYVFRSTVKIIRTFCAKKEVRTMRMKLMLNGIIVDFILKTVENFVLLRIQHNIFSF